MLFLAVVCTCGGQISERRAHMLIAYTCGGQMCKRQAHTLIAYTCGGQMCQRQAHTQVAYTCGGQIPKGQSHLLPWEPSATPRSLWHPWYSQKPLKTLKTPIFRPS